MRIDTDSGVIIETKRPREMSEAFANRDRVAYYRRHFLNTLGIDPKYGGVSDAGIIKFLQQQEADPAFKAFIQSANFTLDNCHVALATQWQLRIFTERFHQSIPDQAKHGLLTDVTYNVFDGFYLCTSTMFSTELER